MQSAHELEETRTRLTHLTERLTLLEEENRWLKSQLQLDFVPAQVRVLKPHPAEVCVSLLPAGREDGADSGATLAEEQWLARAARADRHREVTLSR